MISSTIMVNIRSDCVHRKQSWWEDQYGCWEVRRTSTLLLQLLKNPLLHLSVFLIPNSSLMENSLMLLQVRLSRLWIELSLLLARPSTKNGSLFVNQHYEYL